MIFVSAVFVRRTGVFTFLRARPRAEPSDNLKHGPRSPVILSPSADGRRIPGLSRTVTAAAPLTTFQPCPDSERHVGLPPRSKPPSSREATLGSASRVEWQFERLRKSQKYTNGRDDTSS